MTFDSLGLAEPLVRAVRDQGYAEPTPIQLEAIPVVLRGRDVLGCAETGTGKTAAFALPILQDVSQAAPSTQPGAPRVLVLAPTRELASQIAESFCTYGRHVRARTAVVYGGVGYDAQIRKLRARVEILVATPGRLLDLIDRGDVNLGSVGTLVLDEADRMLDMGFIRDVRRILRSVPRERQTLLFSATMPAEIRALADELLEEPVEIGIARAAKPAPKVAHTAFMVERAEKCALLVHLVRDPAASRTLVFTRTKRGANRLSERLERAGMRAAAIHGNKSQAARERALAQFRSGAVRILVATDIAARGIDVDQVTHVVNFDLPVEPESYVHRIGRTGRAGASGIAWSLFERSERSHLATIERALHTRLPISDEHPFAARNR